MTTERIDSSSYPLTGRYDIETSRKTVMPLRTVIQRRPSWFGTSPKAPAAHAPAPTRTKSAAYTAAARRCILRGMYSRGYRSYFSPQGTVLGRKARRTTPVAAVTVGNGTRSRRCVHPVLMAQLPILAVIGTDLYVVS